MSVREAQRRISRKEFREWRAYFQLEGPHGAHRGDIQAGIIAAAVRNSMRGPDSDPFTPADFLPHFERDEPEEESQGMDAAAARIHLAFSRLKAQQDRDKT